MNSYHPSLSQQLRSSRSQGGIVVVACVATPVASSIGQLVAFKRWINDAVTGWSNGGESPQIYNRSNWCDLLDIWKLEVFSTNVRRDSGGLQPESHDVKSIRRWAPLVVKILNQNKQQAACKGTTIRFHIFCDSQHLFITWKHGIELKFMESWESCFKDFESKTTTTWFV